MYKLSSPFIKKTGLVIISILSLVLNVRSQTLTLAVAANFRDPMNEIIQAFRTENNDILVRSVYGSSGSLYQQISHHAPFDIFFSANTKYPEELLKENIACDTPRIYAVGKLILWSKDRYVGDGMEVLKENSYRKIAIANPELAPYGKGAAEALRHAGIYEIVQSKLVIADNIAQAAQFAVSGNADAGLLAYSQMYSPAFKGKGNYFVIPEDYYNPIQQAVVVICHGDKNDAVEKFMGFMKGNLAGEIITKYGYKPGNL
jgi:molybdate transport system substrate-binding protein